MTICELAKFFFLSIRIWPAILYNLLQNRSRFCVVSTRGGLRQFYPHPRGEGKMVPGESPGYSGAFDELKKKKEEGSQYIGKPFFMSVNLEGCD
jgi:hypothetical protein